MQIITNLRKLFVVQAIIVLMSCFLYSCEKDLAHPDMSDKHIVVSIKDLKDFYKGTDLKINSRGSFENIMIKGVVISDALSGNEILKNSLVIQSNKDGLLLILNEPVLDFKIGDSVAVDVVDGILSSYNDNIAIKGIDYRKLHHINGHTDPLPQDIVIAELTENFPNFVGSLVKITGGHIVDYVPGSILSGSHEIEDGTGGTVFIYVKSDANFSNFEVDEYATYTGIAFYDVDGNRQIWLRRASDISEFVYSIYPPGFPEDFNTSLVKNAYAADNLELNSGNWTFDGVTLVTLTNNRPINPDGTKGVQFNKNPVNDEYLQMNFDVFNGASKVTILYGLYATDNPCTWELEYSTNSGTTWSKIGDEVYTDNKEAQIATFEMNISGRVRFRVHKIPEDGNGRLNMDDFTIFNN